MLVVGVAPLFAPAVGSWLAALAGWRSTFVLLAALGAGLFLFCFFRLPDTSRAAGRARSATPGRDVAHGFAALLRDRRFLALAAIPGLGNATLMAWVAASPFLLLETHRLPAALFPVIFAAGGVCLIGGAQANAALVHRRAPEVLLRAAAPTALALGVIVLIFAATGRGGLPGLLIPLFPILFVTGLGPPNASALALTLHGEVAGTAASFIGTAQTLTSAAATVIVAAAGGGQLGLALVIVGALALALALVAAAGLYRPGAGGSTHHRPVPEGDL
jgi:DHA1 family bicyclomycin/chloramphenicol resistance-like MFS transporter